MDKLWQHVRQLEEENKQLREENAKLKHFHKEIDEKTKEKIKKLEDFYHMTRANLHAANKHLRTIEKSIHENNLDELTGRKK